MSLLARVYRYDVLHIFSASYWSFMLAPTPAILIGKLFGKRTILNYRSGEADDHLVRWRRTAIPTIRLVDRILVPSAYLVDVFAKHGISASYIYNFVDTSRFKFRLRTTPKPVFLSNRNLRPLYNVACTIRAFSIVQQRFPEARLIVAGEGGERPGLENLVVELGLRNVEFIGRVEHDNMHLLYDRADIYLNSSNIDNMPVSIIEAYASGLPLVTTDAGGIPYIVTDEVTGLLVRCNDHEALAAAAIRYLTEEGFAARITVRAHEECQKYSWPNVRGQWVALYKELYSGTPDTSVNAARHTV
jgi:glycosyltransferase involved in cell wall biosynthesis